MIKKFSKYYYCLFTYLYIWKIKIIFEADYIGIWKYLNSPIIWIELVNDEKRLSDERTIVVSTTERQASTTPDGTNKVQKHLSTRSRSMRKRKLRYPLPTHIPVWIRTSALIDLQGTAWQAGTSRNLTEYEFSYRLRINNSKKCART